MRKYPAFYAVLGLVTVLPAARQTPPSPPTPPVTIRYRVDSKNETSVDLTSVGQAVQQSSFGLISWIAVSLSDSAGGRTLHVVVDSMKYEGSVPLLTQATADSAKGGMVQGWIDPNGRVKDLSTRPQNLLLADVQSVIHAFFPKAKAGAKPGDTWSDTLDVTTTNNGANVKSHVTIDYTAGATETVSGAPALRVTATSSATLSGTMENAQAGTMDLTGNAKGNGHSLLSPDGRYLGGQSTSTTDQQLKISMMPTPIPVHTERTVKVTWLP